MIGFAYLRDVLTRTPPVSKIMDAVTRKSSGNNAKKSFSNKKTLKSVEYALDAEDVCNKTVEYGI